MHGEGNPVQLRAVLVAAQLVPGHKRRDHGPEEPDADEVALEAAHVVLDGEFLAGGVEDALLLVIGAGSLLVLGGTPTRVAPGKNGDNGGQRQQGGGAGQRRRRLRPPSAPRDGCVR